MAQLTALKGKKSTKKKARARRHIKGAMAAPLDSLSHCKDYFHIEVDPKECVNITKTYIKKTYDKKTSQYILKNEDHHFRFSFIAGYIHWLNEGKEKHQETQDWIDKKFNELADKGKTIIQEVKKELSKKNVYIPNIQERIQEASNNLIGELEGVVDDFYDNPTTFKFDAVKWFRANGVNQAHSKNIRKFYEPIANEYTQLQKPSREQCEQLREGYSHLDKKTIKKTYDFFNGIVGACDLILQESKANRKTRTPKPRSAEKQIQKLKYCKSDERWKIASINPTEIIDATEVWVFNTKNRKIGKYIAEEHSTIKVKGTTLQFFDENTSVQKTLRKPLEQLKDFNNSGKVQLRKFLSKITTTETKLNGRFNNDTVILKAIR